MFSCLDTLQLKIILKTLADVSTGFPQISRADLERSQPLDADFHHPAVGLRSITVDGNVDFSRLDFVKAPQAAARRQKLATVTIRVGDIIAAARGSSGKAGLVREHPEEPLLSTNNVLLIRAKTDRLLPAYLRAYLQSLYDSPDVSELRRGVLSQWSITRADLENLEIDLPSLDEQQKIAAAFDAVTDARRAASALSEHYDHMLQRLSKNYFKHTKRT